MNILVENVFVQVLSSIKNTHRSYPEIYLYSQFLNFFGTEITYFSRVVLVNTKGSDCGMLYLIILEIPPFPLMSSNAT